MTAHDFAGIATLVLLEALLSADNALVLALLARRLPDDSQRNRALTLGMGLSFLFRVVGLLLASFIIKFWFLRAAGSAYLLYLAVRHFIDTGRGNPHSLPPDENDIVPPPGPPRAARSQFSRIVTAIALTDVAFAVDSILVAVAVTDKMWVILTGVALGIVALRMVASAFLRLLERFPAMEHAAYALVAWAGIKLGLEATEVFGKSVLGQVLHVGLPGWAFWGGMAVICIVGTLFAIRHPSNTSSN